MPQVQPPPFPSPSPSPPLTHPPTVSSQGCPHLSIAPIPLVQAATSLSWSTAPASWRVPKVPCQLVCCLHSGRRNLVYMQHGYVIYSPALLASNPKSGAGQEGSSESGPCHSPRATPAFFSSISCLSDSLPALRHRTLAGAGPSAWTTALRTAPG